MIEDIQIQEFVLPRTDIYHEANPMHHLICMELADIEDEINQANEEYYGSTAFVRDMKEI